MYEDAHTMIENLIMTGAVQAKAVFGFFPANTVNHDSIEIYTDDTRQYKILVIVTGKQIGRAHV